MTRRLFLEGDDVSKKGVFTVHKSHRWPIKDKVAAWVNKGWATWEEEKPDWFTDQWKATVPEDMKPAKKTGDDSGRDNRDRMASKSEGEESLKGGGREDEQKGRRRSVLELISGQKAASSKVMPAGGEANKKIDEAEFMRGIGRMKSMGM